MSPPELSHVPPDPSPVDALAFLWSGKWLIAAVTLLAAGLGVLYVEYRGTIWRPRSVLYVERVTPLTPGTNVPLPHSYASTQAALLRSLPIFMAALAQPGIAGSPVFGDSQDHVAWLRRNLNVQVGEPDDLITVSVDSRHVQEACDLVNAVVDVYLDVNARNAKEANSEVLALLTAELTRREDDLRAVQTEQTEFLRQHPDVAVIGTAVSIEADRFRELNGALTRAETELLEAQATLQAAERSPAANELQVLRAQRTQLLAEATPEHPAVARLDAAIAEAERRTTGDLERRQANAKARYAELAAKIADHERRIAAAYPAQAEYRILELRVDRARTIADALADRVRSVGIVARELNAQVYERATPEGAVVASSKRAIAVIAAFLGLVAGAGLAWFRSLMDLRLRTPADVAVRLPVLGTVRRIRTRSRGIAAIWREVPAFAEAMRSLRTVLGSADRSARGNVLLVTSPQDGDGKSLLAAGLAVAMAQSGQRTLLVDADVRTGTQPRLFDVEAGKGLVDLLADGPDGAAVSETQFRNLRLLASGSVPADAGPALDDARLATALHSLSANYDRVVVDAPSLVPLADARILAACCDQTLLVVRSRRTTRKQVDDALAILAAVGASVAGAILNRASVRNESGGTLAGPRTERSRDADPVFVLDDFLPAGRPTEKLGGAPTEAAG